MKTWLNPVERRGCCEGKIWSRAVEKSHPRCFFSAQPELFYVYPFFLPTIPFFLENLLPCYFLFF